MKIIIAGGRDFSDFEKLKASVDDAVSNINSNIEIVSGTARGADLLGEQYAKNHGYNIKQFPAEWDKYGKAAGYRRNSQMAKYADMLIAFWDGSSKGTQHMINLAKKEGLKVTTILY